MRKNAGLPAAFLFAVLAGCSSSEEAQKPEPPQPSATEMLQKQLNDLKSENALLKDQVARLEQDKRAGAAQSTLFRVKRHEEQ